MTGIDFILVVGVFMLALIVGITYWGVYLPSSQSGRAAFRRTLLAVLRLLAPAVLFASAVAGLAIWILR